MQLTLWNFVASQRKRLPPVARADLMGKTVLIIGANTGIGLATAKHLASMGPGRLILACRSQAKGDAAAAEIQQETGFKGAEVRLVDLTVFASVVAFADAFEADGGRLDLLICNAGINVLKSETTGDGWEPTIQVNHLSTALITLRLLPRMLETANDATSTPRITVVSSEAHTLEIIRPENVANGTILQALNAETSGSAMAHRYNISKLFNILHVQALTAHLPPTAPLVVTSATPGFTSSLLARSFPWPLPIFVRILEWFLARTPDEGARNVVLAALATDASGGSDGMKACYVQDCEIVKVGDFVLSAEGVVCREKLWEETVAVLEKVDSRVRDIVEKFLRV